MISVYTGFPGSGKSLHAVSLIYAHVRGKAYVCTNILLNGFRDNPYYIYHDFEWFNDVQNVQRLSEQHLQDKIQLLFVIDEAQVLFDSRAWSEKNRMPWNIFFSMHRHYKTNFVLITQSYANLDRRIRANIEYQHQHVNIKNATHATHILLGWLPDFMFCSNQFYANGRERIATHWVFCRRKYTRLYNTFDRDGLTASGTVPDSGTVTETDRPPRSNAKHNRG